MKGIRLLFCSLALAAIHANAQIISPGPPILPPTLLFPQVRAYLGLTDTQVSQLLQSLNDFGRLVSQRQQRMFQVQSEIRDETAKSPLDPSALGIRYAEIEAICRNIREEALATQTRNLALLTDPQKLKLKALDDAYKLLPVINEAQNAGLLSPPASYPYPVGVVGSIGGILGFPVASLSGCQQPAIPTSIVRMGDYTGAP